MITRNIVILPDTRTSQRAIAWSQQVSKKYRTSFVLDGKQFYPHITLYQAAYPNKNLPKVEKHLLEVVKHMTSFRVQSKEFSILMGFIFLNVVKSKELVSLHKKIVSVCNPLREGIIIPSDEGLLTVPDVSAAIKNSIRTYGSALVMEAYRPHITLSRVQNTQEATSALSMFGKTDIMFDVHGLSLADIGPDGTVNDIVKDYTFSS